MKYMGSKTSHAKELLEIVLNGRDENQFYIEPFMGGCNMIDKVTGNRIANDIQYYLVEMFKALQNGWVPPKEITKEEYIDIRDNKDKYTPETVGYVGFLCSYSGKWFGGYAGKTKTKLGTIRDYQDESYRNINKQMLNLIGVTFENKKYSDLIIPENSIIYCDPPYENTTKYSNTFDHSEFWQWVRDMTVKGHKVYVSEYTAPSDFTCIWEKKVKSSLSANGKIGGSKESTEKLFVFVP